MQANLLLRRIRLTCEPVKAAIAGSVAWHKQSGTPVEKYDTLATVRSLADTIEITSPYTGILRTLVIAEGEVAVQGAILCYIEPDEPLPATAQAVASRPPAKSTSNGRKTSEGESPLQPPTPVKSTTISNGHTNIPASGPVGTADGDIVGPPLKEAFLRTEGVVECDAPDAPIPGNGTTKGSASGPVGTADGDVSSPAVNDKTRGQTATGSAPTSKKSRPKTRHRSYHVTDDQEGAIRELSLQMKLDRSAPNVSESELVRCAIEMLLELPQPALLAMIEKNRAKEKAERYGTGWPRPGNK